MGAVRNGGRSYKNLDSEEDQANQGYILILGA